MPPLSSAATALWNCSLRRSSQRPYGSASCGGSAAKRGTTRSSGGTTSAYPPASGAGKRVAIGLGVAKQRRRVLGCDDVEADLARELQPREVREAAQQVHAPAETLAPPRARSDPHVH